MPQQIKRLAILFLILGVALVVARRRLVPKTFGEKGHYRAAAIDENASRPVHYAGHEECATCHPDIVATHDAARHKTVACEVCHGAAAAHIENPVEHKPPAPRDRTYCPVCHAYDPARPTGFPQIDPVSHNPVMPCIKCHNPHAPVPPRTPQECSACHGEIARTKGFSKHATLNCTECHQVDETHKKTPLLSTPTKPASRDFCGRCHGQDSKSPPEILKVDLASHNPRYVCWQCHYSHYPEVQ
jgi:DnaJ-class molecular chaperone